MFREFKNHSVVEEKVNVVNVFSEDDAASMKKHTASNLDGLMEVKSVKVLWEVEG